jgi:hypothetical protein
MPDDIPATLTAMTRGPAAAELQRSKQLSPAPRVLAVGVGEPGSEGTSVGRLVVIGSSQPFSDEDVRTQPEGNIAGQILAASLDWLRDRPFVEVASKPYGVYVPKAEMDANRAVLMPLGLMALLIGVVGGTVWIVRRK